MKKIFRILTGLLLLMGFQQTAIAQLSVTVRLDSVNLLMGNTTTLYLQVVKPLNPPGKFPIFDKKDGPVDYVGVCGDSVELRTNFSVDTTNLGSGKIQLDYKVPIQAFDSGTYRLPQFVYIAGNDSAASNNLTFNVVPVQVTADDQIAGFAGVEEPEGKKFYDFVPDWILDFWWIFIIIAIAIIFFLWAMRRYKRQGSVIKFERILSPYEIAINALNELKAEKLWEQGMEKEYFTRLTDILRTYLMQRFGINAMEMTTRQIIDCINDSDLRDKKEYVRQTLNIADFVKFAKVRPLPADNIASFENALRFVEETGKEEVQPETSTSEADKNSKIITESKDSSRDSADEDKVKKGGGQ